MNEKFKKFNTLHNLKDVKSYQNVMDIFSNGDDFLSSFHEENKKNKKRLSKRKTLTPSKSNLIMSLRRYSRTISDKRSSNFLEINEKLKDYSILSELSEENFSAFSGENSVYTLSDEISNNCQIKIQSILTNIKKKINFKNKLPISFLNIQNNLIMNEMMNYEGSKLIIDTGFNKKKENKFLLKENRAKNPKTKMYKTM